MVYFNAQLLLDVFTSQNAFNVIDNYRFINVQQQTNEGLSKKIANQPIFLSPKIPKNSPITVNGPDEFPFDLSAQIPNLCVCVCNYNHFFASAFQYFDINQSTVRLGQIWWTVWKCNKKGWGNLSGAHCRFSIGFHCCIAVGDHSEWLAEGNMSTWCGM